MDISYTEKNMTVNSLTFWHSSSSSQDRSEIANEPTRTDNRREQKDDENQKMENERKADFIIEELIPGLRNVFFQFLELRQTIQ